MTDSLTEFAAALRAAELRLARARERLALLQHQIASATEEIEKFQIAVQALRPLVPGARSDFAPAQRSTAIENSSTNRTESVHGSGSLSSSSRRWQQSHEIAALLRMHPDGLTREELEGFLLEHPMAVGWNDKQNAANTAVWRAARRGIIEQKNGRYVAVESTANEQTELEITPSPENRGGGDSSDEK
ncbi:MAG: hypothetical protein QM708_07880 [Propioniciclava sp.]|uniref:hypothetical protein n=1 Tax=Propioniciclava sp. TaxID=2038686 RepID=UPI0039E6A93B